MMNQFPYHQHTRPVHSHAQVHPHVPALPPRMTLVAPPLSLSSSPPPPAPLPRVVSLPSSDGATATYSSHANDSFHAMNHHKRKRVRFVPEEEEETESQQQQQQVLFYSQGHPATSMMNKRQRLDAPVSPASYYTLSDDTKADMFMQRSDYERSLASALQDVVAAKAKSEDALEIAPNNSTDISSHYSSAMAQTYQSCCAAHNHNGPSHTTTTTTTDNLAAAASENNSIALDHYALLS